MSLVLKKSILVLALLSLVGCGSSSETKLPTPTDPNAPPTMNDPNAPNPNVKPGIPDLTGAAPVQLLDNTTYAALENLFGTIVYGPLVGDAKLKLTLTVAGGVLRGKMLFGFEDSKFWRDMQQNTFENAGAISTNAFDVIFQDDAVVTRVRASRAGNQLTNGYFMYRARSSSDPKVHYVYPGTWQASWGARPSVDVNYCASFQWMCSGTPCPDQNDVVTPCRQYIDIGVAGTNQVGNFDALVSDWVN